MQSRLAQEIIAAMSPKGPHDLLLDSLEIRWVWLLYGDPDQWSPSSWFRDRAVFAYAAVLKPLRWLRAGRKVISSRVIACGGMDGAEASRSFFLHKAFGETVAFLGGAGMYPLVQSPRLGAALQLWLRTIGWSARAWLDPTPTRYSRLGFALALAMDFEVVRDSCDRLYVFNAHNPEQYLAASYAHQELGLDVRLVDASTPLYQYHRATHLDCTLVLCSRIQEYELEYYASQGTNRARGLYAGSEHALDLEGLSPAAARFHLAYYSSGTWARDAGRARSGDIEAVRAGAFLHNPAWARDREILDTIAGMARERGWRLKIYPHPYERTLAREHGIDPPYMDLVDDVTVYIDTQGSNSHGLLGEALVAVSLQSTLIFERLDAGFNASYVYFWNDPMRDPFEPAAVGPFADRRFSNMDELRAILDADLAGHETDELS